MDGPAQRYHRRGDEINTSSSNMKVVGGMHGEGGNFVNDSKFVSRLGRRCSIGRF